MTLPPDFRGRAVRMTPTDLIAVAKLGGYEVAALQAVMDIEAGGAGFENGRPKILVERHVFYAQLGAGPKRNQAVRDGLAYLSRGTLPYPATQDGNYALLTRMMAVDATAALRSVSYGIGQVMGFNHLACGFDTVQDMVAACCESEAAQFRCMLRFVERAGLGSALKRHDWAAFAAGYNGPGQRAFYAGKLAAAYARRVGAGGRPVTVSAPLATGLSDADRLNDAALVAGPRVG